MESTPATSPDLTDLTVGHAVSGGACLARVSGRVVLVSGALPGERVRARVTREGKSLAEAVAVEIVEPHAGRREAPCPHASACGGCDFQHAEPSLQAEMKRSIIGDAYRRIAQMDVGELLEGPDPLAQETGTRNRIRLTYDPMGHPGLFRRGTHEVVPLDACPLLEMPAGEDLFAWARLAPPWHRVSLRMDSRDGGVVLFESPQGASDKARRRLERLTKGMERSPAVRGVLADRRPLGGDRELRFRVGGREFRADATSFFQGSLQGAEQLAREVARALGEDRDGVLMDLYAGVGLLSVLCGQGFDRVVATDTDRRALRFLRGNLRRAGVRAETRSETAARTLTSEPSSPSETIVIDPPRAGLDRETRAALIKRAPRRIVSVSCDPATGARDTKALIDAGWRLESLRAIDLFPVTAHVETVALFVR